MRRYTAEEKLELCYEKFAKEEMSTTSLRHLRDDLYRIDIWQLSEELKEKRKSLLSKINKLLRGGK